MRTRFGSAKRVSPLPSRSVIFWRSHREWDSFPADIPHYTTYREEETGH